MKFKIHRGTKEIGGSCVEIYTASTRILLDCGMPLVAKGGGEFDFNSYKDLSVDELVCEGVLPNVLGLYDGPGVDGLVLSHAHLDHYGLFNFVHQDIDIYLGRATHKLIKLNSLFTPNSITVGRPVYFEKEKSFKIGDILVTPYLADHSAFDSYSFLIEADNKKIFYSGDFRGHGRKAKVFEWFTQHAPKDVDYLLLEGTSLGRENKRSKSESDIETEFVELFKEKDKINLVYTSGQNIDRLVSIYRACIKTDKVFVVDVYVAEILTELSLFAKLPYPSATFKNMRVIFPYYTCKRLKDSGHEQLFYKYKNYKITKAEIDSAVGKIVMVVRPSMQKDLDKIANIDGGNIVYSMWEGYLEKSSTKKFLSYLEKRQFDFHIVHTSGHADLLSMHEMADALMPKAIIPIHTFLSEKYKDMFKFPVIELNDGEETIV